MSLIQSQGPHRTNGRRHWVTILAAALLLTSMGFSRADAAPGASDEVITRVRDFWDIRGAARAESHPVRLEFTVCYYDPAWNLLWADGDDGISFIVCPKKPLPIEAGQRIEIEGTMTPAVGLSLQNARLKVLPANAPLKPAAWGYRGEPGQPADVRSALVTVEGFVNRQAAVDDTHVMLEMTVRGLPVETRVLLSTVNPVPQCASAFVRIRGVMVPSLTPGGQLSALALWVARPEDVEVIGSLATDARFQNPVTPIEQLPKLPAEETVRVAGTVARYEPGRSLVIRDETGQVTVVTGQTDPLRAGDPVEAIGYPALRGTEIILREGLFRPGQGAAREKTAVTSVPGGEPPVQESEPVITRVREFWEIPPDARAEVRHVRLEFTVCYYDPEWSLLWAEGDDGMSFISLPKQRLPIAPGQRIEVDGSMSPAIGLSLEHARIKVVAENVPLRHLAWDFRGELGKAIDLPTELVSVVGFVNRQYEIDPTHVMLDMTVNGVPVQARMLTAKLGLEPQCGSAFVRARGVMVPNINPAGQLSALALWIARLDDVEVIGRLATDTRFERPATPVDALATIRSDRLVRVVGTVWSQEPGRNLTIRDGSGQVVVLTGQSEPLKTGEPVEAVGYPAMRGIAAVLREGLYRAGRGAEGQPPTAPEMKPKLRLADQVLDLRAEQAATAYPVEIFGVVTWSEPDAGFFYVSDSSGGIRVVGGRPLGAVPKQGDSVQVAGVTGMGDFAPVVLATTLNVMGSLALPEARAVTLEQALTGIEEGQWIEMNGYLRDVGRDGKWARLDLTSSGGSFTAYLPPAPELAALRYSVVKVRGVCSAVANERRQLVGIRLWVPSNSSDFLQVVQTAPADPFSVPVRTVASLRQFSTLEAFNRRVRVAGTVLYFAAGRLLYLQDGPESIEVLSEGTSPLAPGDRVEAVGFPGWQAGSVVLREAVCRRVGRGEEPPPMDLDLSRGPSQDWDGHLVRTTGLLLDTADREDAVRLMIQTSGAVFEALLDRTASSEGEARWEPGSRLALTGVYRVQYDEYTRPRAFQVQLRSARDVRVLTQPPWLTTPRALTAAGTLALCTVLGIGWVATLRRRVRRQTTQIREQLERQSRLEAELLRSSKLESLGILAGGIAHDFNNLLTVIMGNLTLAKLDAEGNAVVGQWLGEAEQGVMRARDLTLQLLTFAKGGDPVRKAVALAEVVRETAEFALHGSNVRCEFDIARDLWPANVDKGQIGQVVQNIVINAMQAMPQGGVIRIRLGNTVVDDGTAFDLAAGRYLKLSIADTGAGIDPEHLALIFDPYFTTKPTGTGLGLATVYSIVKKHAGRIEVRSKVGAGTTFEIWLPAAQKAPSESPLVEQKLVPQGGRVLLMDDEEAIRRSATALLQRIGMEVLAVDNGDEAVREFSRARAAARPFDLVILDLTVPGGMGGRETVEKLREVDPQVRALVSSGYSSDPVLAQYRAHGFLGMVPKPYDLTELSRAIQGALKHRPQ